MSTDHFLDDETGAAHELFAELLAALVGDIVSGDHEPLSRGHVLANLVHLAVHRPPLRLVVCLPQSRRRP